MKNVVVGSLLALSSTFFFPQTAAAQQPGPAGAGRATAPALKYRLQPGRSTLEWEAGGQAFGPELINSLPLGQGSAGTGPRPVPRRRMSAVTNWTSGVSTWQINLTQA